MRKSFKIIALLSIVYIIFYFIMNFILNEDILISRSFKSIFFEATNIELITISIIINSIFYSLIFYRVIKAKSHLTTLKFKFIEFTFIGTLILFIPYLLLIINTDLNDFFYNYTCVAFILYISIYIFGILLFILTSKFFLSAK